MIPELASCLVSSCLAVSPIVGSSGLGRCIQVVSVSVVRLDLMAVRDDHRLSEGKCMHVKRMLLCGTGTRIKTWLAMLAPESGKIKFS